MIRCLKKPQSSLEKMGDYLQMETLEGEIMSMFVFEIFTFINALQVGRLTFL